LKGKNFSGNNKAQNRNKADHYQTPYSLTRLLFDNYKVQGNVILEPCYGKGAISKIIKEYYPNHKLYESDLYNYETGEKDIKFNYTTKINYYQKNSIDIDTVITNPPFKIATDFILKSKEIAKKEIVMLLPLSYLHGKGRYDLIYNNKDNYCLKYVYIFTRYPFLKDTIRKDGKVETGMQVYSWMIWINGYNEQPIIRWLDNNDYVVGTKKIKHISRNNKKGVFKI
jgi:hypothetical protein